jgi:hypothetical protein
MLSRLLILLLYLLSQDTGKPKGFAFLAYEDQKSTILAVDNFNGTKARKVLTPTYMCSDIFPPAAGVRAHPSSRSLRKLQATQV